MSVSFSLVWIARLQFVKAAGFGGVQRKLLEVLIAQAASLAAA